MLWMPHPVPLMDATLVCQVTLLQGVVSVDQLILELKMEVANVS